MLSQHYSKLTPISSLLISISSQNFSCKASLIPICHSTMCVCKNFFVEALWLLVSSHASSTSKFLVKQFSFLCVGSENFIGLVVKSWESINFTNFFKISEEEENLGFITPPPPPPTPLLSSDFLLNVFCYRNDMPFHSCLFLWSLDWLSLPSIHFIWIIFFKIVDILINIDSFYIYEF